MAENQRQEKDLTARLLRLADGRVVVPTEYQGATYICVVLHPRATRFTLVKTSELLAAKEIEV